MNDDPDRELLDYLLSAWYDKFVKMPTLPVKDVDVVVATQDISPTVCVLCKIPLSVLRPNGSWNRFYSATLAKVAIAKKSIII